MESKQYVIEQPMCHKEIRKSKNTWTQMNLETQYSKIYGTQQKWELPKREVYSDKSPSQEIRKISNKQFNLKP